MSYQAFKRSASNTLDWLLQDPAHNRTYQTASTFNIYDSEAHADYDAANNTSAASEPPKPKLVINREPVAARTFPASRYHFLRQTDLLDSELVDKTVGEANAWAMTQVFDLLVREQAHAALKVARAEIEANKKQEAQDNNDDNNQQQQQQQQTHTNPAANPIMSKSVDGNTSPALSDPLTDEDEDSPLTTESDFLNPAHKSVLAEDAAQQQQQNHPVTFNLRNAFPLLNFSNREPIVIVKKSPLQLFVRRTDGKIYRVMQVKMKEKKAGGAAAEEEKKTTRVYGFEHLDEGWEEAVNVGDWDDGSAVAVRKKVRGGVVVEKGDVEAGWDDCAV